MKPAYHTHITRQALGKYLGETALQQVLAANLGQDALRYQVGHDHFHYDANAFAAGDRYIETCRQNAVRAAQNGQMEIARAEFGRLTHAAQDFYAHSNYTALWREQNPQAAPEQIHPLQPSVIKDPRLRSGKLYYPLEILSFVSIFQPLVLPLLPRDSHAWMNKDHPSRPGYAEAEAAAIQRTEIEWQKLAELLTPEQNTALTGWI